MPDKRTKIAGAILAGLIAVGGGLGGAYMADKGKKPEVVEKHKPVKPHVAEACVIIDHTDKSRIGEVIAVQKPGFEWGDFESGKVRINGVSLSVFRIMEHPDPGDVSCGRVGYDRGKLTVRKGRCAPEPDIIEVQTEEKEREGP